MPLERSSLEDGQQPTDSSYKSHRQVSSKPAKRRRLDTAGRVVSLSVKQLWFDRLSDLYSHLQQSSVSQSSAPVSVAASDDGGVCMCRGIASQPSLTVADYLECIESALSGDVAETGPLPGTETAPAAESVHLLALTCCHLVMTVSLQQRHCVGRCCGQLQRLAARLPHRRLLQLLSCQCLLSSELAARCIVSSCRLLLPASGTHWLLHELVEYAAGAGGSPGAVRAALFVLQRLVELPVCEAECAEDDELGDEPDLASTSCRPAESRGAGGSGLRLRAHLAAELSSCWLRLTQRFCHVLADAEHQEEVLAFLSLWTALLSVNNSLSVTSIGAFYGRLECLAGGLTGSRGQAPAPVWRAVVGLYSEVLCYGSTLALQPSVDEETVTCAHTVLRLVRGCRLLEAVPPSGAGGLGLCGEQDGDGDQLVQAVVLLVLKAVAVTVKESRGDSSSSSCSSSCSAGGARGCSSGQDAEEWQLLGRSLWAVLRRVDAWLKQRLPHHHPQSRPCEWCVPVLAARDDWLLEALLCLLDVGTVMQQQVPSSSSSQGSDDCTQLASALCAHTAFVCLLETVHYQHDLLLDFLLSTETCFLLYLLRQLKFVRRSWKRFVDVCGARLSRVMAVLIRLRLTLRRLVTRQLFPYNVAPLLKLLDRCELLYEEEAGVEGEVHQEGQFREEADQFTRLSDVEAVTLPVNSTHLT